MAVCYGGLHFPAAGLAACARAAVSKYVIDPRIPECARELPHVRCVALPAGEGVAAVARELME